MVGNPSAISRIRLDTDMVQVGISPAIDRSLLALFVGTDPTKRPQLPSAPSSAKKRESLSESEQKTI